jgi:copper chaperone CopZ
LFRKDEAGLPVFVLSMFVLRSQAMPTFTTSHLGQHHCHLDPVNKPVTPQQLAMSTPTTLLVQGMGCPTCAMRVRNALLDMDGVLAVDIALERGLAFVRYDPAQLLPEALPDAVSAANDGRHCYTARVLDSL